MLALLGDAGAARCRPSAASGASGIGRDRRSALLALAGAFAATNSGVAQPESRSFTWSALVAAMLRYATPLLFARARRDHLRAQRA